MLLSTPAERLSRMIEWAAMFHVDQYDKAGKPYILHPLKVAHTLRTSDMDLMAIAVGHDLVEDCFVSVSDIKGVFGCRIADAIDALTKRPTESYVDYMGRVKKNKDAVLVKMQDLRHNSDLRRLKGVTDKDFERTKKYMKSYHELELIAKSWEA